MCVAAAVAGAALVSAAVGAYSASEASDAQVEASQNASNTQVGMQQQIRSDLAPYRQGGVQPLNALNRLTGTDSANGDPLLSELLRTPNMPVPGALPGAVAYGAGPGALPGAVQLPGAFTQAELEATPGYQFTRDQGLKAVMNMGAKGGFSGGTLKGAADFATGLSDATYNTRFGQRNTEFQQRLDQNQNLIAQQALGFDQSNTGFNQRFQQNQGLIQQQGIDFGQQQGIFANLTGQQQNVFNRLMELAGMGQASAAQTGQFGAAAASGVAQNQIGAGNAQAAGYLGIGNAVSNGANGLSNYYMMNKLLNLYGGGGAGGDGITDLPNRDF